jgi:hypothetical protein
MKPNADIRTSDAARPSRCAHGILLKQISYDAASFHLHPRYTGTNCDEQRMTLFRGLTVLALNYIAADCTSRIKKYTIRKRRGCPSSLSTRRPDKPLTFPRYTSTCLALQPDSCFITNFFLRVNLNAVFCIVTFRSEPVPVVAQYKAVFHHSPAEIIGSNPTGVVDVCLL